MRVTETARRLVFTLPKRVYTIARGLGCTKTGVAFRNHFLPFLIAIEPDAGKGM